jgi:hypothetical protein
MDLYSVTTVMKEHDGYKNASFHWFYCDARTIPRPYADLIANYNGMNRLRAAYAEGYIDDHLHWTKPKRSRTTWIELLVTKERPRSKNASCRSRKMWWVGERLPIIAMSGSWMKFQAIRYHSKLRVALTVAIHLRIDKSKRRAPNTALPPVMSAFP